MSTQKSPRAPKIGRPETIDPVKASGQVAAVPQTDEQKRLRALIERRHPKYEDTVDHWDFLEATYEGGREWFAENIFKYIKEGDKEFQDRLARCYRFNHTREVVDLVNKYLFKQNVARSKDAPESVKRFWERATRGGLGIRDFARQADKKASTLGRIGVVVDNPSTGDKPVSRAEAKKAQLRTYAYLVGPKQLLDYAFDDEGKLLWVLIEECYRDAKDPFTSDGEERPRWRLWDRDEWTLYEERTMGRVKKIVRVDGGTHGLGEVPVILHDNVLGDEQYVPPSLIDDVAYLDRAVANYLSNLDAIIQDQTFSQLTMPAQNLMPGEDNYNKMLEMGTKRVFLYDGGVTGASPQYISPDPKQAQMILAVIHKIINEIYHTVGLAGERTKEDNALGIDNSSGVAKAYDFERVNALLASKADALEVLENKIVRLVGLWNGETVDEDLVSYPDNFDVRSLYDEFDMAARLALVEAPQAVRQEQMKALIDKLFPQIAKDLKDRMLADLKDWPIDPIEQIVAETEAKALHATAPPNVAKAGGAPQQGGKKPTQGAKQKAKPAKK
jgi:hypothetical protein